MIFGKTRAFLKRDKKGNDILLTGVPRSGTTLACRLLSEFSQTIALNEPIDKSQFTDPKASVETIRLHFKNFRKSLLQDGTARARTLHGQITDNAFSPGDLQRERIVKRSVITFDKNLEKDFTLVMKYCAEFSLLLPDLANHFSIYAMIRNPLALLASWASVDVPVSRGRVALSDRLNPAFHKALSLQGDDLLTRQLFILSWYFGQYKSLPPDRVIRYEDLITHPIELLSKMAYGEPANTFTVLQNKNTNSIYNKSKVEQMAKALLNSEGHYWSFYTKESVVQLLNKIIADE